MTNVINDKLRQASGSFSSKSKLIAFLYQLMRDYLTPGQVEEIFRDANLSEEECLYSNGWLA
jgi:hypothetical protein